MKKLLALLLAVAMVFSLVACTQTPKTDDTTKATEKETEKGCVLELRVNPGDMGKVIGKQGRIARSIRAVVKAAASKEDRQVSVEIEE